MTQHLAPGRRITVGMLRRMITVVKWLKPGKKTDVMPMWVGLHYAYSMSVGLTGPDHLDNDRYRGIEWQPMDDIVRRAYAATADAA